MHFNSAGNSKARVGSSFSSKGLLISNNVEPVLFSNSSFPHSYIMKKEAGRLTREVPDCVSNVSIIFMSNKLSQELLDGQDKHD